jgi:Tol biopolymer transport system component/DNA-binding winged helix-turn-helix (wHTH) protein
VLPVIEAKTNGVVKFGIYEVNPRLAELRRNGVKVKLQEQPFQVLTLLLEKPGEVVSRDDLQKRLWPSDTFVDFDHSLNAAVRRLRDALGDSADNPRFIETLARRGYRFVAPVNGHAPAAVAPPKRRVHRAWLAVAIAVLVTASISVGWHAGHRPAAAKPPSEERLTANSSDAPVSGAALSPNGKLLAYVDPRGIFLREIDSNEVHALPLPDGFRAKSVKWFPDGDHVLAAASAGWTQPSGLWNISILGGAPHSIVENSSQASVSTDGRYLAFFRGDKLNGSQLFIADADGSNQKQILDLAGFPLGSPAWSPDGKTLAFTKVVYRLGYTYESVTLETLRIGAKQATELISDIALDEGVSWLPDGRILFSRMEDFPNQVSSNVLAARIDPHTGRLESAPTPLTSGPDVKMVLGASADGKRLAFLRTNIVPSIYVGQLTAGTKQLTRVEKLTLDEQQNRPYDWTPDSKAIFFISNREGGFHIFRQQPGQAAPEMVVGGTDMINIVRLNADGTELLYLAESPRSEGMKVAMNRAAPLDTDKGLQAGQQSAGEHPEQPKTTSLQTPLGFSAMDVRLMRVPISGGNSQPILQATGIHNFQCARAPARECLFSQFTQNGIRFFEFDPGTGAKTELTRAGDPQWQAYNWSLSPDGQTLALAKKMLGPADALLRLIPTKGGSERTITVKDWSSIATIDWAADGKSLWASAVIAGETRALVNIDLQGHAKAALVEKKPYMGWAIPSPDGKKLAFWESTGDSNVWMLKGF